MTVVILEHDNYRGRTEKRYQIMRRLPSRNGLDHVTPGVLYTLDAAKAEAEKHGWEVLAIGGFYHVV